MRQFDTEGLPPLLALVETYRHRCYVPIKVMAPATGVAVITYYGWLKGSFVPRKHNLQQLMIVGKALKSLFDEGELPLDRGVSTKKERDATIKDILTRRVAHIAPQQ